MGQKLSAYRLPKETVTAIMMLYRNRKVKVRSPDRDADFFDIVAGILQGNTLAPYLFIVWLDYLLRTSIDHTKENGFILKKKKGKKQTISCRNYNGRRLRRWSRSSCKCTQVESLLHSQEQAAKVICLYVNLNKTEYMRFNREGAISTLNGGPMKLVDKFM